MYLKNIFLNIPAIWNLFPYLRTTCVTEKSILKFRFTSKFYFEGKDYIMPLIVYDFYKKKNQCKLQRENEIQFLDRHTERLTKDQG